jgi:hypothetical protein
MTDRLNALTVILEQDLRSDAAEPLIAAIRQLRGVLTVEPIVADAGDFVALTRARRDLEVKLWAALQNLPASTGRP